MKLSEARRRYIGKQFRIKHAERGYYRPYIIEGEVGVCTAIEAYWHGELERPDDIGSPIINKKCFFKFRIDIPGNVKWFSVDEIEPFGW